MARVLRVWLTAPSDDLVHEFRNFGESVYTALGDQCDVQLDEIDRSTSEFHVRGIGRKDVRTAAATVRKVAGKYRKLADLISVEETTEPD